MLNDHPEIFWIDNNYSYSYNPEDGSIKEITFTFYDFADTPEKFQAAKAEFDAAASSIIAGANAYSTIVERELYIHDYICENTVYDETAPYNQSAYSALVLHRSVCAGYARSFQYLMQKSGSYLLLRYRKDRRSKDRCRSTAGKAEHIPGTWSFLTVNTIMSTVFGTIRQARHTAA